MALRRPRTFTTEGPTMKSRAAVLHGVGQDWDVTTIDIDPRASMPLLLSMYEAGDLKLDELVTRRYKLDEINDAIEHLRDGRNIRGVIDFNAA